MPSSPYPQAPRARAAIAARAMASAGRTRRASYCPAWMIDARSSAPDPAGFRAAMGMLPTGVTVVAATGPEGPAGATANAVSSLSIEPMLMLACLDRGSRTLLAVQAANRFGISVLHAGQEEIARAFASKAPVADKWEGVAWSERDGVPAIDDALATIACDLRDVIAGGDHVIVTGEVTAVETAEGTPLVFHESDYRPLG